LLLVEVKIIMSTLNNDGINLSITTPHHHIGAVGIGAADVQPPPVQHPHVILVTVAAAADDGESPPGSTDLDDETGHNCKMPHNLYRIFCTSVLGLPSDSWAITQSEAVFKNLILHNLNTMMYYFDTDTYYKN